MTPYFLQLATRLANGAARLPADLHARHAAFVRGKQRDDGGFAGRDDASDLYYTSFALRILAMLDGLSPQVRERAAGYLRGCLTRHASVVDLYALLASILTLQLSGGPDVLTASPEDWRERIGRTLADFRTPDGGYNKSPGAASGSTYHTFLVGLCFDLIGESLPAPERILAFVRGRRRDDGGFVEVAPMRRSGTNPTAAGLGLLQLVLGDQVPREDVEPALDFLAQMPSMEGGLRANDRIPLADLLSTFTGCWSLAQYAALERIDARQACRYAESLQHERGGFLGGLWDEAADVEYTFYGLATLALLWDRQTTASVEA
jgi:geranylgeranyl transferase type-2 subunit beta